jgi:hypothetical protein
MPFATADDLETRTGRTFTVAQTATATLLVELASELIADTCGKTVAALDADDTPILRIVCIEVAARAMANPDGLASSNERLGAWASTKNFREAGLYLTDLEERLTRRAVFGSSTGSARVASTATEVYDFLYS